MVAVSEFAFFTSYSTIIKIITHAFPHHAFLLIVLFPVMNNSKNYAENMKPLFGEHFTWRNWILPRFFDYI
jgi:hypothetical protein